MMENQDDVAQYSDEEGAKKIRTRPEEYKSYLFHPYENNQINNKLKKRKAPRQTTCSRRKLAAKHVDLTPEAAVFEPEPVDDHEVEDKSESECVFQDGNVSSNNSFS